MSKCSSCQAHHPLTSLLRCFSHLVFLPWTELSLISQVLPWRRRGQKGKMNPSVRARRMAVPRVRDQQLPILLLRPLSPRHKVSRCILCSSQLPDCPLLATWTVDAMTAGNPTLNSWTAFWIWLRLRTPALKVLSLMIHLVFCLLIWVIFLCNLKRKVAYIRGQRSNRRIIESRCSN